MVKTSGVKRILVRICGAGGAGSGVGEAGGAGGYAEEIIDVTGVSSISVTVGQPGSWGGTYYSGGAANGGTHHHLVTTYLPSGGNGANRNYQHCGGLPGVGSGGQPEYIWWWRIRSRILLWLSLAVVPSLEEQEQQDILVVVTMPTTINTELLKVLVVHLGYHGSRRGARGMAGIVCVWNFR